MKAKGEAESRVIRAEAEAIARLKIAGAEAKAIDLVQKSVPGGDPLPYLIALQYMKMLPEMVKGKNDKLVLMPYEASSLIGSLGSIKKLFQEVK